MYFLSQKKKPTPPPASLKVWITEWTTESYDTLKEWFKLYAPEYAKMDIIFEKKNTDPLRYRTLLLSTMTDDNGPDIFMIRRGEDQVLEGKIEPIPSSVLDFSDFDKKYDDIFTDLVSTTGSKDSLESYLQGVPLGFETFWIFYNKWLIREVPKTWNDVDLSYEELWKNSLYATNLGLGPSYTPNVLDILGLLFVQWGMGGYNDLKNWRPILERYLWYSTINTQQWASEDIYTPSNSLSTQKSKMQSEKTTTYDMFLRGEIAMIFWYPSIIAELEKSAKRAGTSSVEGVILTERIPNLKNTEKLNIARYSYFGISKFSKNPEASVKFIEYLMTSDAQKRYLSEYPYLISAQREFWWAQSSESLSSVFPRMKLDVFIPLPGEKLKLFSYGLKPEMEQFLGESIDRNENIDINNILSQLSHTIDCSIQTYIGWDVWENCEKK